MHHTKGILKQTRILKQVQDDMVQDDTVRDHILGDETVPADAVRITRFRMA